MTYEETLAALAGLMGKPVNVTVRAPGNPALPGLASIEGTLAAGDDMSEWAAEDEADPVGEDHMRFRFA